MENTDELVSIELPAPASWKKLVFLPSLSLLLFLEISAVIIIPFFL
jgi:hypothetical protein